MATYQLEFFQSSDCRLNYTMIQLKIQYWISNKVSKNEHRSKTVLSLNLCMIFLWDSFALFTVARDKSHANETIPRDTDEIPRRRLSVGQRGSVIGSIRLYSGRETPLKNCSLRAGRRDVAHEQKVICERGIKITFQCSRDVANYCNLPVPPPLPISVNWKAVYRATNRAPRTVYVLYSNGSWYWKRLIRIMAALCALAERRMGDKE